MTHKPKILDMFCGAGGAAMGYQQAGFDVVGVDINPQTTYPFEFHQADALEFCREHGHEFDAIHASPPCQVHSRLAPLAGKHHLDLIPDTRAMLQSSGLPYVIENVPGAPLLDPVVLCGSMFNLKTECGATLLRHRLFELSFAVGLVPCCQHEGRTISIFGNKARDVAEEKRRYGPGRDKYRVLKDSTEGILFTLNDARLVMQMPWANFKGLSQAIPPAYTEWIGKELRSFLASKELTTCV